MPSLNLPIVMVLLSASLGLVGCDKPPEPSKPATPKTDGEDPEAPTPGVSGSLDLCGGLSEALKDLEGFAPLQDALCGAGDSLKTLRSDEYVYTGGDPKMFKPKGSAGDGTAISVRLLTSTLVEAKATDYFALIRLQVSKPKRFKDAGYERDGLIELSEVAPKPTSSSFKYEYSDGTANVAYRATARFYTLKQGQAFVSATSMDEAIETMHSLQGLVIVNQKDETHSEVFTLSDQTYDVAPRQDPKLYDQSATKKAGLEQQRMFRNAARAGEAKGLLETD